MELSHRDRIGCGAPLADSCPEHDCKPHVGMPTPPGVPTRRQHAFTHHYLNDFSGIRNGSSGGQRLSLVSAYNGDGRQSAMLVHILPAMPSLNQRRRRRLHSQSAAVLRKSLAGTLNASAEDTARLAYLFGLTILLYRRCGWWLAVIAARS
jgi:hypothetical protein